MRKRDSYKFFFLALPLVIFLTFTVFLILYLFSNGLSVISWEFLTQPPRRGMTEGGIFPVILGSLMLAVLSLLFSVPVGVAAGIYLAEYARENLMVKFIRSSTRALAGIPSIVYGLFGVALFVRGVGFGPSLLSSSLTLAMMNLPWIISTTEETMRAIPMSFREGALALGASKWEAIRSNVLPYSLSGILTGILLAFGRTIGETAPILFTGVTFYSRTLPKSLSSKFMALPYHLFVLSTQHESIAKVRVIAFGTAVVLLGIVLIFDALAFAMRLKMAKTQRWEV